MRCVHVRSQAEYDATPNAASACVHVAAGTVHVTDGKVAALGESTVVASGNAVVRAYGNAVVQASGEATVTAYGATVHASEMATVRAYDSATVTASPCVAVYRHSPDVTITGGTVIEVPDLHGGDPAAWCAFHGLTVEDGHVVLYKGVGADLRSDWGFHYPIGETVTAPDWEPTVECGNGLHLGPSPRHTLNYVSGDDTTRFLACRVAVDGLVPLGDKVKVQRVEVLYEVDRHGQRLATEATP